VQYLVEVVSQSHTPLPLQRVLEQVSRDASPRLSSTSRLHSWSVHQPLVSLSQSPRMRGSKPSVAGQSSAGTMPSACASGRNSAISNAIMSSQ